MDRQKYDLFADLMALVEGYGDARSVDDGNAETATLGPSRLRSLHWSNFAFGRIDKGAFGAPLRLAEESIDQLQSWDHWP